MTGNQTFNHAFMGEMVGTCAGSCALSGNGENCQILWMPCFKESLFQRPVQCFGKSSLNKSFQY